ncbi:MAG: hypothetical protein JNK79_05020 [Chitinophagaceae bacterium]|nr:hypothetical protein [Chitinophagaceae bacterium]
MLRRDRKNNNYEKYTPFLSHNSHFNIGDYYFVEGGTAYSPTPGVYTGVPGDFVDFKSDGTVELRANNSSYQSTYSLHPGDKLVITNLLVHDTGRVVLLNATNAVLDWSNTSRNGGKYFRRMYLKH